MTQERREMREGGRAGQGADGRSGIRGAAANARFAPVLPPLLERPARLPLLQLALATLPLWALAAAAFHFLSIPRWVGMLLLLGALLVAASVGGLLQAARDAEQVRAFGQYTLVRKIGEGGMGVVYEASHARLRRPTAIKLIRTDGLSRRVREEALARFEREAQLTSQLSHPNTVIIYDYGRTDEGVFYYAMEYIDGIDLERFVRVEGPLPPARVIHLALQICGSLCEAHQKALIHRDIKPGNVLVCDRGGIPDTIKVLDFGLAKRLDGPVVSGTHVMVGTPLYMAPEVTRDPSRASRRSDIYSLGAVMHWLATGTTLQEAALLSNNGDSARAGLPVDLERVIMRCLEPSPFERPESVEELMRDLKDCRDHQAWSVEDARLYWRERGKRLSRMLAEPAAASARTLSAS